MKEYIIKWNSGCGYDYDIVNAESNKEAEKIAYEYWREEIESNADYGVLGEATDELKEEYGL